MFIVPDGWPVLNRQDELDWDGEEGRLCRKFAPNPNPAIQSFKFVCTRAKDHHMPHVASAGLYPETETKVVAVWDEEGRYMDNRYVRSPGGEFEEY
jgi:hypothetical protein